jgi:site-specific recombinase XerD
MARLYAFIYYLDTRGLRGVGEITPLVLSEYLRTTYVHHEKSMSAIMTAIRTFLKFLYLEGYIEKELAHQLPQMKKYYCPAIPSVWRTDDVKRMLNCIDRGNPVGKRDFAILLLAAKLGMRVGDIKGLRLRDLNWDIKTIEVNQSKTGRLVNYPILDDVGWALIDYLRNGRPCTDSQFVFVRMNAPFDAFGENANLHNIITKYTRLAGIRIPLGARHGLHSLRHTLASTLLERGTPLPLISSILGHLTSKSTSIYLQTSIEGLRRCALDPEEVFSHEE